MVCPVRALVVLAVLAACGARADDVTLERWRIQVRDGPLHQDVAREVVRRVNRSLYARYPGMQLLREDEDVALTVALHAVSTEAPARSIVEVSVGPVVERDSLEDLLGSDLIDSLLRRNYYWIEEPIPSAARVALPASQALLDEITATKHLKDEFWWSPAAYSLSLSYGFARLSDRAGIYVEFGQDECDYPLWSAGTMRVGVAHEFIKAWVQTPLLGANTETFFTRRKLDGAFGAGGAFDVGSAGGEFGFADLSGSPGTMRFLDSTNIHYVSTVAQAYYILAIRVAGALSGNLRLKFGGGMHQVVTAAVDPVHARIVKRDRGAYRGGPYLKAEFAASALTGTLPAFEGSLQYYNGGVLATAVYNVTEWLGVEGKLGVILAPDPWEQSLMWSLSPRIRIL